MQQELFESGLGDMQLIVCYMNQAGRHRPTDATMNFRSGHRQLCRQLSETAALVPQYQQFQQDDEILWFEDDLRVGLALHGIRYSRFANGAYTPC